MSLVAMMLYLMGAWLSYNVAIAFDPDDAPAWLPFMVAVLWPVAALLTIGGMRKTT